MGLPCVKSGRFARIDGAVAPLNATSGRFARLDTEIGTLTVMNGPFRVQRTFLSGNPRGATAKPFRQQQAEPSGGRRAEPGRTGAPRGPIAALGLPPDQLFINSRCGGVGYNYEQYA